MTPEEIAARTRLEQEGGRNAVRRFTSNPALQERYMADFVPAEELAHLPIDPDVKLPDDVQATIARGEAEFRRSKKSNRRKQGLIRPSPPGGPSFITFVDKEVQDRRDAALSAREKQSEGKRGQPPMLVRLRVGQIVVDWFRAKEVPLAISRNSRMNKLLREWLNERAARSRDRSKSRCKQISADAVQRLLRQIKELAD